MGSAFALIEASTHLAASSFRPALNAKFAARLAVCQSPAAALATASRALAITFAVVFVFTVNGMAKFSQRSCAVAVSVVTFGNSYVSHSVNGAFCGVAVTFSASFVAS